MRRKVASWLVAVAVAWTAPAAWAEDVALVVVNTDYEFHATPRGARALLNIVPDLEDAGYDVVVYRNLDSRTMAEQLPGLHDRLRSAGRKIFVIGGHVVRDRRDSWLLLTDADRPGGFEIGRVGLSLGALMDHAASNPGTAVIAIGDGPAEVEVVPGFTNGPITSDVGQGVLLITGGPRELAGYIRSVVLKPGQVLRQTFNALPPGVALRGYLPRTTPFTPDLAAAPPTPVPAPPPAAQPDPRIERMFWQRTRNLNTPQAYEDYLRRYPGGRFAAEAARRAEELRLTPEDLARIDEEALQLTRQQRRDIQQQLTLLGFDTRGVDGIFGARTRSAVRDWQGSVGVPVTGYLTANQISRIDGMAAQRAEELRAEAEARRREEERRDRAFWRETGAEGTEAGLRAYLARYPDGVFSDRAEARLNEIEREQRRLAEIEERNAWDAAVSQGTLQAYRAYLRDFPDGRFAEEARARVASLSNPETPPEIVAAARDEEESLRLNTFRRQLIEGQLRALNLDPGAVDGNFDRDTRRALRRFQRAANLQVTGFVTRDTIVRLLASAISQ